MYSFLIASCVSSLLFRDSLLLWLQTWSLPSDFWCALAWDSDFFRCLSVLASSGASSCSLPFPSLTMTFLFDVDGHPVSVDIRPESRSYVSASCAARLGFSGVAGSFDGAVSVKLRDCWPTCIVTLVLSETLQDFDVALGCDWQGLLKELCMATGYVFPTELVILVSRLLKISPFIFSKTFNGVNSHLLLVSAQSCSVCSGQCRHNPLG